MIPYWNPLVEKLYQKDNDFTPINKDIISLNFIRYNVLIYRDVSNESYLGP